MPSSVRKIKISNPLAGKSREDRTILAICLGIAFFFWVLVKLSQEYPAIKEVQLNFETPVDKTFLVPPPTLVPVNIKGSGWNLLFEFLRGNRLNLSYQIEDSNTFFLSRSQFRSDVMTRFVSNDLVIENLNFEGVQINLEDQSRAMVPVRIAHQLSFASEHQLAAPVLAMPDSVEIIGPQSLIDAYQSWPSDTLRLQNVSIDYSGTLDLQQLEPGIQLNPGQVEVSVDVEQYTQKSLFVPVTVLDPPEDSIRIFPDKIKVSCVVGMRYYNELDPADFTLVANLDNVLLGEGKTTVPLELTQQPEFVKSVLLNRRSAEFYIIKREAVDVDEPTVENQQD